MPRPRIPLVLSAAVMVASLAAAAPTGAYSEKRNTGTTALYTITDEQSSAGVICRYRDGSPDINDRLRKVRVRPFFSHAPFKVKSYVGYRFQVQRQRHPYSGPWETVSSSPILRKLANQTEVAFFPAREWTAPTGTKARFRVRIQLYWYAKGSTSNVIGRASGLMEAYRHRHPDGNQYTLGDEGTPQYCRPDFHGLIT